MGKAALALAAAWSEVMVPGPGLTGPGAEAWGIEAVEAGTSGAAIPLADQAAVAMTAAANVPASQYL